MFRKFLFFLFTGLPYCSRGQSDDSLMIRKIADEVLVNGKAYENLRTLCKTVGGRLAGSPQMVKAENWGIQALKDAGAYGTWLQECMVPHWVRGGKDQAYYSYKDKNNRPQRMVLDVLALGNSVGTGTAGIQAPVILLENFDELEKRKDEVKGKIVFFNYKFDPRYIATFLSYRDAVVYRGAGPSRAARYGAIAVLIRSMSHSTDNNPHTGATRYADSLQKIPAAALGLRDADKLATLLSENGNKGTIYLRTLAKLLPDTIGHNVIGEIKGSELPGEIITIGGHLDSWDPGEGAHDDGAGCVHAIEVLRVLKEVGYQPRRTIRVVLFANEENGLRGGTKYAEEAKEKGEKHYFALESDAGGFTPRGFGFTANPGQMEKIQGWTNLFKPYGVYELTEGGGGADIGPLRPLGATLAGLSPDSQRYFDLHHARNDVFENVSKRELELGAINMAALVYLVDKYGL